MRPGELQLDITEVHGSLAEGHTNRNQLACYANGTL